MIKNALLALGLVTTLALAGCQNEASGDRAQSQSRAADTANSDLSGNYDTNRNARTGNSHSNEMQQQSATVRGRTEAKPGRASSQTGQPSSDSSEQTR